MLTKHLFSKIPWNKIYIYIFQGMLLLEINLVNLKQTHPKGVYQSLFYHYRGILTSYLFTFSIFMIW